MAIRWTDDHRTAINMIAKKAGSSGSKVSDLRVSVAADVSLQFVRSLRGRTSHESNKVEAVLKVYGVTTDDFLDLVRKIAAARAKESKKSWMTKLL